MDYSGAETTGFMSPARDSVCGVIDLATVLDLRAPEKYLVRVHDEGLIGRGIMKDDVLVIDTRRGPSTGSLVVLAGAHGMQICSVCKQWGVWHIIQPGGMRPLMPDEEIWGVAVSLVRAAL